ncbi:hypothetical protein ABHA59_18305 [Clostridium tertium]
MKSIRKELKCIVNNTSVVNNERENIKISFIISCKSRELPKKLKEVLKGE